MVEVQSKDTEGFSFASEGGIIGKNPHRKPQAVKYPIKEPQLKTQCPGCGSLSINRNGFRRLKNQTETQVYRCRECSLRFSENYYRHRGQHEHANYALKLEAKKLDNVTETKTVTGDEKTLKGKLTDYHFKMKIDGYKDTTIEMSWKILELLTRRGADLTKPDTVKKTISEQNWSGNRRRNVINAYGQFIKYLGSSWDPPRNTVIRKIPFIPTEQEIDDLIAGCPVTLACYLQLLKETAMRSGEAINLKWRDIDIKRRVISCNNPEKGSNSRQFPEITGKLLNMLSQMPQNNEYVFSGKTNDSLKAVFVRCRAKQAFKLGNQRLKEIHFHTFRHWKATMMYHYTKDILAVQEFLGHRSIENTQLYIQLDKKLFAGIPDDKFIIRAVHSIEEATQLGEVGFEPFMVIQGIQLMRKRK